MSLSPSWMYVLCQVPFGIGSPGTGAYGSCEPPYGCRELSQGPLQKQHVPFSTELSPVLFLVFEMVSQCSTGWPGTQDLPASASGVLEFQVCTILPCFPLSLLKCVYTFMFETGKINVKISAPKPDVNSSALLCSTLTVPKSFNHMSGL